MKRHHVSSLATVALAAAALVGWGGAASAREAEPYAAEQKNLPPLPADIKERKRLNICGEVRLAAVRLHRCAGQNAGFDVEIATWFSRFAFGKSNRVNVHVRHDTGTRAGADDGPRGHGHRDVHLHRRP